MLGEKCIFWRVTLVRFQNFSQENSPCHFPAKRITVQIWIATVVCQTMFEASLTLVTQSHILTSTLWGQNVNVQSVFDVYLLKLYMNPNNILPLLNFNLPCHLTLTPSLRSTLTIYRLHFFHISLNIILKSAVFLLSKLSKLTRIFNVMPTKCDQPWLFKLKVFTHSCSKKIHLFLYKGLIFEFFWPTFLSAAMKMYSFIADIWGMSHPQKYVNLFLLCQLALLWSWSGPGNSLLCQSISTQTCRLSPQ